jgi:hypothetical protein
VPASVSWCSNHRVPIWTLLLLNSVMFVNNTCLVLFSFAVKPK